MATQSSMGNNVDNFIEKGEEFDVCDEHMIEECVKFDGSDDSIDQVHEDGDEHIHMSEHINMIDEDIHVVKDREVIVGIMG